MTGDWSHLLPELMRHIPFLLLVLPVIGAVLIWPARLFGEEVVCRIVWTNLLLSLIVTSWLVFRFQPETDSGPDSRGFSFQMSDTAFLEPGGKTSCEAAARKNGATPAKRLSLLRVATGVDGWSLWPLLLIPLLYLPALSGASARSPSAGRWTLLLLTQAAVVGVFSATDVVQWVISLELTVLLLFLSAGHRAKDTGTRRKTVSFAVIQLGGSLLLLLGLTLLILTRHWRDGETTSTQSPEQIVTGTAVTFSFESLSMPAPEDDKSTEALERLYKRWEPVLFAVLLLGLLIKAGVFPLHGWFAIQGESWAEPEVWIGTLLLRCAGVYGYGRIVAGCCPQMAVSAADGLCSLLLFGGVFCGLIAVTRRERWSRLCWAASAHLTLIFSVVVSLHVAAVTGAVFLLLTHLCGFGILGLSEEFRFFSGQELRPENAGHARSGLPGRKAGGLVSVLAILALAGSPGFSGFPGLWLSLQARGGGMDNTVSTDVFSPSIVLLTTWALLRPTGTAGLTQRAASPAPLRTGLEEFPPSGESQRFESPITQVLLLPLLLVLMTTGLAPQFVVDRTQGTARKLSPQRVVSATKQSLSLVKKVSLHPLSLHPLSLHRQTVPRQTVPLRTADSQSHRRSAAAADRTLVFPVPAASRVVSKVGVVPADSTTEAGFCREAFYRTGMNFRRSKDVP